MKAIMGAVMVAVMMGCSREPAPVATQPQPKWMREDFSQKTVAMVTAAAPDPDIALIKLTPAEVKAALEAASPRGGPAPEIAPLPRYTSTGETQIAEQRMRDFEASLTRTIVEAAGGKYHSASCPWLWMEILDRQNERVVRRVHIGEQITLAVARDRGLQAHDTCAPPSYYRPR